MLDSLTRFELQKVLLDLWGRDQKTAFMVTHDVDEALYLADRAAMMTNGPEAEVGEILKVDFPRPRDRKAIMDHPHYYRLREHLITFLEERAEKKRGAVCDTPAHINEPIADRVLAGGATPDRLKSPGVDRDRLAFVPSALCSANERQRLG